MTDYYWDQKLREIRHNPCLMRPVTALILLSISVLMLLSLLFQFPGFLLGFLLAPLTRRSGWFIEFLYPSSLARWGHIFLLRLGARSRNASISVQVEDITGKTGGLLLKSVPLHSRAIEQRIEVIQGRVYIHPLPQLLDNVGYLIVGLPASPHGSSPIIAILIDCGEADSVKNQMNLIQKLHYPTYDLQLHLILSTHKHHDHTAGIQALVCDPKYNKHLKYVCGGAVENVPCCNYALANGDKIPITSFSKCMNDMENLVEIECISVPCHTRGSTVFALTNKVPFHSTKKSSFLMQRKYLFTGDAMFSGGGGVPFEADLEFPKDRNLNKKTPYSTFRPGGGSHALERCFIEILIRSSSKNKSISPFITSNVETESSIIQRGLKDEVIIFPGHEYTTSLLQRQLDANAFTPEPLGNNQWGRLEPSYFFEVASNFFIANHRRSLPKTLRLLTVPTTMETQLKINPTYRLLRKRGEQLISAIKVWYQHHGTKTSSLHQKKSSISSGSVIKMSKSERSALELNSSLPVKTPSTRSSWNQDYSDIQRPVFTTVYSSDLESIIDGLNNGKLDPKRAAYKLSQLSFKLDDPVIVRSPVPGTLPNDKLMFLGMLALSALGSPPTAMTNTDSRLMKLGAPEPSSDYVLISKTRLIHSLRLLGLVTYQEVKSSKLDEDYIGVADNGMNRSNLDIVEMINLLWEGARIENSSADIGNRLIQKRNKSELNSQPSYDSVDMEKRNGTDDADYDLVELGILKLCLYSLPSGLQQGFPKICLPCGTNLKLPLYKEEKMNIKRSGGELISHDVGTCPLCRGSVGCPEWSSAEMESYEDDLLLVEEHRKRPADKKISTKELPKTIVDKKSSFNPKVDDTTDTVEIVLDRGQPTK